MGENLFLVPTKSVLKSISRMEGVVCPGHKEDCSLALSRSLVRSKIIYSALP